MGFAPGIPVHIGQMFTLAFKPFSLEFLQRQNNFSFVTRYTCISSPIFPFSFCSCIQTTNKSYFYNYLAIKINSNKEDSNQNSALIHSQPIAHKSHAQELLY